jgi:hypothetical protein
MVAGLVFGCMGYSSSVLLFEEGEDACRGLAGRLVEERYDVLRAVLDRLLAEMVRHSIKGKQTSPNSRLNML